MEKYEKEMVIDLQTRHRNNEAVVNMYREYGHLFDNRYQFDQFYSSVTSSITRHIDDPKIHSLITQAYDNRQSISSMLRDGIVGHNGKLVDIESMGYTRYIIMNESYVGLGTRPDPVEEVVKLVKRDADRGTYDRFQLWDAKRKVFGLTGSEPDVRLNITKHYKTKINARLRESGLKKRDGSDMGVNMGRRMIFGHIAEIVMAACRMGVKLDEFMHTIANDPTNISRILAAAERIADMAEEVEIRSGPTVSCHRCVQGT